MNKRIMYLLPLTTTMLPILLKVLLNKEFITIDLLFIFLFILVSYLLYRILFGERPEARMGGLGFVIIGYSFLLDFLLKLNFSLLKFGSIIGCIFIVIGLFVSYFYGPYEERERKKEALKLLPIIGVFLLVIILIAKIIK